MDRIQQDMKSIEENLADLFCESSRDFDLTSLEGGLCGGVMLLTLKKSSSRYILKKSGNADDSYDVEKNRRLMSHLKGVEPFLPGMAKAYLSFVHDGEIYVVYKYLGEAEKRNPTVEEIIFISSESFRASKQYDHRPVEPRISFERSVLNEIRENGLDRYSDKYFLPYVNDDSYKVISWMSDWAEYFIGNQDFKELYMQCPGFIHRDIHRDNIMISNGVPHLIDYDHADVDNRLFDLTRPMVIYMDPDIFLETYSSMKDYNKTYMTPVEREIIDRIAVLDILACSGWEAKEIGEIEDARVIGEFDRLLRDRVFYLKTMMENPGKFNLDFI